MTLQTRISDLITAIGTDYKGLRTWITGTSNGDLTGLTTTAKTNLVAAINEVKAGNSGTPPDASEITKGIAELATQAETDAGTDDLRIVTPLKHKTNMVAYAQPLDADLTAIAAVASQTAYGRAFLALANQAGLIALLPTLSETAASIIELATQTETNTGTDDVRAVTPLKFQTRLVAYAQPLATNLTSLAAFTTDTTTTLGTSDTKLPTQNAVKTYVDGILDANNAYQYKGVLDCAANPNYPAASAGWTYKVSVAGKVGGASGINVEVGDSLTCLLDGSAAGTQASVGANWIILQTNVDGGVVGPASAVSGQLASYSGTTGKIIADSGLALDTDGALAANSDVKLASQKAVKTYVGATTYTQTQLGNYDTDLVALYSTAKT